PVAWSSTCAGRGRGSLAPKGFRFGGIEAARRLHQRIESAPACPRAFLTIGAERNVDDPGPHAGDVVRAEAERRDGPWPIALHKYVHIPQHGGQRLPLWPGANRSMPTISPVRCR